MLREETAVGSADWNAWARFSNDVTAALKKSEGPTMLFSVRKRVVEALWDMGYRPPEPDQVPASEVGAGDGEVGA